MIGVGDVAEEFFARELAEIKLGGVGEEKLIAAGVDEELGHREAVAIRERVFDGVEGFGFGRAQPIHDAVADVIADGRCEEAVGAEVMIHGLLDVEHVNDEGDDGDDAAIDGGGGPGGPAAFGGAGDDESVDLGGATFGAGKKGGGGVHGAHGGLGHGEARGPAFVPGAEKLIPTVGDEIVFDAGLAVAVEGEWLVGHHAELDDDGLRGLGDLDELAGGAGRSAGAVGASADEEEGGGVGEVGGFDDGEPVAPLGAIDLGGREPVLGNEIEDVGGASGIGELGGFFPSEGGVGLRDVAVERGRGGAAAGGVGGASAEG